MFNLEREKEKTIFNAFLYGLTEDLCIVDFLLHTYIYIYIYICRTFKNMFTHLNTSEIHITQYTSNYLSLKISLKK